MRLGEFTSFRDERFCRRSSGGCVPISQRVRRAYSHARDEAPRLARRPRTNSLPRIPVSCGGTLSQFDGGISAPVLVAHRQSTGMAGCSGFNSRRESQGRTLAVEANSVSGGFRLVSTEHRSGFCDRSYRSYSPKLMRGLFGLQSPGVSEGSRFSFPVRVRQHSPGDFCKASESQFVTPSSRFQTSNEWSFLCAIICSEIETRRSR